MVSPKVVLVVVLALIAAQDMYRAVAVRSVPHVVAPVAADHSEQPQGDASASATPAAPASSDVPDAAMLPDIADARSYSVGDRVHVSLCVGCQYGGKFNKLKQEIEAALPGIQVTGSNHPVGFARTAASYAVLGAQAGLGALILAGDKIFEMLGKPMPGIVNTLQVRLSPPPLPMLLLRGLPFPCVLLLLLHHASCRARPRPL